MEAGGVQFRVFPENSRSLRRCLGQCGALRTKHPRRGGVQRGTTPATIEGCLETKGASPQRLKSTVVVSHRKAIFNCMVQDSRQGGMIDNAENDVFRLPVQAEHGSRSVVCANPCASLIRSARPARVTDLEAVRSISSDASIP